MSPLTFATLAAAQTYAERLRPPGGAGRGGGAGRLAPDGGRRRDMNERARGGIGERRASGWRSSARTSLVKTQPGLAAATAIFRSLPLRVRAQLTEARRPWWARLVSRH